jgi:hypothetical protein
LFSVQEKNAGTNSREGASYLANFKRNNFVGTNDHAVQGKLIAHTIQLGLAQGLYGHGKIFVIATYTQRQ